MTGKAKTERRRADKRLYRSAKISDYQFKQVLLSFARDETVAEAAQRIRLSVTSIHAIYGKLRTFFVESGLFNDPYRGGDPRDGIPGEEMFEHRLIAYHFERVARRRGLPDTSLSEVDPHWNESHWRFYYHAMTEGRQTPDLYQMMFSHLLAHIRLCGPVGAKPRNRRQGFELMLRNLDDRILWLERNTSTRGDTLFRQNLKKIRQISF